MNTDPQFLVQLMTARSPLEAEAIVAALKSEGIEAIGFNYAATTLSMAITPLTVSVHREDLERAKAVLAEIRKEAASTDWDSVDVGEMPDEVKRELRRKPVLFPKSLAKWVLYGLLGMMLLGVVLNVVGIGFSVIRRWF